MTSVAVARQRGVIQGARLARRWTIGDEPETRGVDAYKDVTPRVGLAYDLMGTGKTVLRMTVGNYLEGARVIGHYANTNPSLRMPQTTPVLGTAGVTRAWTDANQNFVPDCDLTNPAAQDLRASGDDRCGVMSNTRFGQNVLTNNFDAAVLDGWGVRPADWVLGADGCDAYAKSSAAALELLARSGESPEPAGGTGLPDFLSRATPGGMGRAIVFVPGSPNPSQGRLLRLPRERAVPIDLPVDRALKELFSLGKVF